MDLKVGGPIARVVEPVSAPDVAVIVVVPCATPLARPALLMLPKLGLEEVQAAVFVKSIVLPSVKIPVAVNCCLPPTRIENWDGATLIDAIVGATTVTFAEPSTNPKIALIAKLPWDRPVTTPVLLTLTVFTPSSAFQATEDVKSLVVPSL